VTNTGPFNATNIIVDDVLPSEVSLVNDIPSTGFYSQPSWIIPFIEPGDTETLLLDVDILIPNSFNNTAEIISVDQFDTNLNNDNQTVLVSVQSADLAINKTVDQSPVNYNDTVTFTVVLNNTGPNNATNIEVVDSIPFGLTDVTNTTTLGTYDGVFWDIPQLNVGDDATLTITGKVSNGFGIFNDAEVTDVDQFDPDSTPANSFPSEDDQDSAFVDVNPAELSVNKTVDKPITTLNSIITFEVNVTNAGPSNATNVQVIDSLPFEISSVTNTTTSGFYDGTHWDIPLIEPGTTETLTITGTITSSNNFSNTASVSPTDQLDNFFSDNEDFADVTVLLAELSLLKAVDTPFTSINDVITFTVDVTNNGPNTATNINVSDTVPSELSLVTNTTTSGFYDGSFWAFPSILAGQTETLTITGTHTNTHRDTHTE